MYRFTAPDSQSQVPLTLLLFTLWFVPYLQQVEHDCRYCGGSNVKLADCCPSVLLRCSVTSSGS